MTHSTRAQSSGTDVFEGLADGRRRYVLLTLRRRSGAIPEVDVATEIAAREAGTPLHEVSDDERRRVHVALHHTHLPKLRDAGLIERDREARTVALGDHPALRDPDVRAVLEIGVDDPALDELFGALADARRRTTLAVLGELHSPIERRKLAARVAARERGVAERELPDEAIDRVETSLRHKHLPKLRDAGLIERTDEDEFRYEGGPALRARWLDGEFGDGAAGADAGQGVRTIEGRENVIAHGQSLIERADDELFLMITTTGLLKEGCMARIQDAVDRGVDVYLGSQDARVHEVVRERVPDVTIWEPQLDWLNFAPERERIGRLVFADREAIMLGTLGEESPSGTPREVAIAGAGPDNALVVLVRELLGTRLDHLDAQSDDVLTQLPF